MNTSTYYNLNLVEGTDIVNPLVVDVPNYEAIDEAMHDNSVASVGTATELLSGSIHAITRDNADAAVFRFVATSDWTAGDTMTIDGIQVTAKLPTGEALGTGAYVINANVLAILTGTLCTVLTAGGVATTADNALKLGGELPAYYGKATDVTDASNAAQAAGLLAQGASTAVGNLTTRVEALETPALNIGAEEVAGSFNGKTLYRKRYRVSGVSYNTSVVLDSSFNTSYVDDVVAINGAWSAENNGGWRPFMAAGSWYAAVDITPAGIQIGISNMTVKAFNAEIIYTKA